MEYHKKTGSLEDYPEADKVTNEELLELPCDILAPCAVGNQIHKENATKLQCRIVVEGANAPTTPEADDILDSRGISVVPDILANSAGITTGYFEWVQGLMRLFWTEDEVYKRLEELVLKAFDKVFDSSDKHKTTLRAAAMRVLSNASLKPDACVACIHRFRVCMIVLCGTYRRFRAAHLLRYGSIRRNGRAAGSIKRRRYFKWS